MNWDACIAVWDSYTDMNCHLGNTWILWLFWKFGQLNLLFWRPPYFSPCTFLYIIFSRLVLICIRSHVGFTCIFAIGWVGLYFITWLESRSQNFQKSKFCCPFMSVRALHLPHLGTCHQQLIEIWHEACFSVKTSSPCISCSNFLWGDQ